MSEELLDRFNNINNALELKKKEQNQNHLQLMPKEELIYELLNSSCNNKIYDELFSESLEIYNLDFSVNVSDAEINELIKQLNGEYDSERLNLLMEECKKSVLDSIIKPFGIAGVLFKDKDGGNVDTIHNVRNGVYATDENKKRYNDREDYDYKKYHDKNENYKKHQENISKMKKDKQSIIDDYTKLKIDSNDTVSIEHIISASDISNDPAVILAKANGADLANDDSNLCYINGQLNSSINSNSPGEYLDKLKSLKNPEARQNMLNYLNNKTKPLTEDEIKAKKLLEQKNAMLDNEEEIRRKEKDAKKNLNRKLNKQYYTSKDFVANVGKTSAKEGFKMGIQQAIGLVMREFTLAIFDEIKDIFHKKNEIKINKEFLISLKERLERISKRVLSKWKDVVEAFEAGAISSFFSNIITIIINAFFKTGKRAVKMIREGFYSLLRALKMLFLPNKNLSREEAAHEASKLIASGLIITGGIAIEEVVEKALGTIPIIGGFSNMLTPVVMGIVTGLSMALITYLIDKVDFFNVNLNDRQEYISSQLDRMIEENLEEIDSAYNYIINPIAL